MAESGTHLATSRVNRLLRPLRNKCSTLAALQKTPVASRVTHSKQSSSWDSASRPPLTILSFLGGSKKLMLDTRSMDEFELSRRIHAVCDAFKNIALVAFGQPYSARIPSLAAMCSLVVGRNMPPEDTLADSDEDSSDNALGADDIYETVPPYYRRFLIVSHALFMILSICTHHHTLINTLLDHCLSFGLVHESKHLLTIIIAQAFLPFDSSHPPPALHPGHTNYLLDLHARWTTGNKPSGTSSDTLLFTTSAFCRALMDTLSQSCHSHTIWTSRVLDRLLHVVESCDIDSYIFIIRALSQSLSNAARESVDLIQSDPEVEGASSDVLQGDAHTAMLRSKASELISNLFDHLFIRDNSHSSPLASSRIYAAIEILHNCRAARLHHFRRSTPGSAIDLPDILITFATHIFVSFRDSVDSFDSLLTILDDSSPVPTTFSKLMVYFSRFQRSQAFGDFVEAFLSELRLYSSAFLSEKLFKLDASLWACALHHFETSIATSQTGGSVPVTRYKQQLMEAVDKAERRCFGGDLINSPIVSSIRPARAGRTHHARTSGHWEWEDMVGSWIRKTPVHKKRKINDSPPLGQSRSRPQGTNLVSSKHVSTPLSTRHRPSSTFSPSSSYSQSSDIESRTEEESEYLEETDKENCPSNFHQGVEESRRIKRRSSNFFSLLADAQVNRIILHPKSRSPSVIPEKYVLPLSSQESQNAPRKQAKEICCRKAPRSPEPPDIMPLSDDSLNLFAYATSSPARL